MSRPVDENGQLILFEDFEEEEEWQEDPRFKSPQEMVREYHEQAGLPIDVNESPSKVEFRETLIDEEVKELFSCFDEEYGLNLPEEALKELADIVYVVYGYAVTFGWNLDEAVRRVHENNMERMYQDDGTIHRREDGKIIKNPSTPKVDLEDLV